MAQHREHAVEALNRLPPGMALFAQLILLLTALPLLFVAELAYIGHSASQARLWTSTADRFGDFWHYRQLLGSIHTPEFFTASDRFAYPAPCAIIFQALYHLGAHPHVIFNLIVWTVQGFSGWLLLRALLRRRLHMISGTGLVLLMAFSSYPWYLLYDRGNLEVFVYLFVGLGVWAWLTGHEDAAAIFWGCAGAMKIYPLLLLALYTRRGQWRRFTLGLLTCGAVLLLSFWYVGPSIRMAANGTISGIRGFVETYGAHTRNREIFEDHSLLGAVKQVLALLGSGKNHVLLSHVYEAAVALLATPLFLLWRRSAPPLNQLCVLLIGIVLFPPVSYDYTLVYAYLVIGIVFCDYLVCASRNEPYPAWKLYALSFALLCTTQSWIEFAGISPNGLLKTASLITVVATLVRYPLRLGMGIEEPVPNRQLAAAA